MIITPVENIDGLFTVENVYDLDILESFLQEDVSASDSKSLEMQERFVLRKNIESFPSNSKWNSLFASIDQSGINELGYRVSSSALWIDSVGHEMDEHADNPGVIGAMQVYLKDGPSSSGTTFFSLEGDFSYIIPFKKNCGYLMINKQQRHGLLSPITKERWSTYNWLAKLG